MNVTARSGSYGRRLSAAMLSGCIAAACDSGPTPGLPALGDLAVLELVEEVRIGSVDDPDVGFSNIGQVRVAPSGEIYVVESSDRELRVYSADGALLRSYGGAGDGPGEFNAITDFGVLGDTVWVSDASRRRLTLFSKAGDLLGTVTASIEVSMGEFMGRGLAVIVYPRELRPDGLILSGNSHGRYPNLPDSVVHVPRVLFDLAGNIRDTLDVVPVEVSYRARQIVTPMQPGGSRTTAIRIEPPALDSGTYSVAVGTDTVAVHWSVSDEPRTGIVRATRTTAEGDTLFATSLGYDPRPVEPEWIDSVAAARATARRMSRADSIALVQAHRDAMQMPPHHPPVSRMQVADDGSVWIPLNESDAAANRWVALAADGRILGLLDLDANVRLAHRDRSQLWVVERDTLDVPWLVRYRIDRAAAAASAGAERIALTASLFGVVAARNDTTCLRVAASLGPPPDSITVVIPYDQRVVLARVAQPPASCPDEPSNPGESRDYQLDAPGFGAGDLGIAILAPPARASGAPRTDLDGDGRPESYRACTSSEGVHLSVWAGEALRSARVWHHYHYLGYDVEPSCVDADFPPVAAPGAPASAEAAAEFAVRGDSAIVTGRLIRERGTGADPREERWSFTKLYVRTDVGWRVVAFRASGTRPGLGGRRPAGSPLQ